MPTTPSLGTRPVAVPSGPAIMRPRLAWEDVMEFGDVLTEAHHHTVYGYTNHDFDVESEVKMVREVAARAGRPP